MLSFVLLVLYYAVERCVNLVDSLRQHGESPLSYRLIILFSLYFHMEVSTSLCAIHHARLAIEVSTFLILSLSSVSVEFCRELNLGLDLLVLILKGHFGELHAQLILSRILSFILVLHIRVHITVEELVVVSVFQ